MTPDQLALGPHAIAGAAVLYSSTATLLRNAQRIQFQPFDHKRLVRVPDMELTQMLERVPEVKRCKHC